MFAAVQSKDISAVLAKDAFLVFRALCKLSTRSSESSTGTDPTAIRGKVRCQIQVLACESQALLVSVERR